MTERPQHELLASPWLSNGQIAAIKVAIQDGLEDAESWLGDGDADLIRGMVRRGEPLDLSVLSAVLTEEEVYNARWFFWLLQADRALMSHITPRSGTAGWGLVWLDENDERIDPARPDKPTD